MELAMLREARRIANEEASATTESQAADSSIHQAAASYQPVAEISHKLIEEVKYDPEKEGIELTGRYGINRDSSQSTD